jgi:hypothetical protein
MAGGPNAAVVACLTCLYDDGVVTKAERVVEGVEDDQYQCALGHGFGVDWSRGEPATPQWPPDPEEVAAAQKALGRAPS